LGVKVSGQGADQAGNLHSQQIESFTLQGAAKHAPTAADDVYQVDENSTLHKTASSGVLVNDSDADGDTLNAILVAGPAHGTLHLNADGSFDYTPELNFSGSDSFSYKANDGVADSNPATVQIIVNHVNQANHPPQILSQDLVLSDGPIPEGGSVDLSGTFTDPDVGQAHTVTIDWGDGSTDTVALAGGMLSFGPVRHTYLDNPAGTVSHDYQVTATVVDDANAESSAPVHLTVNTVAPIFTINGPASVVPGVPYEVNLSAVTSATDTVDHWTINWGDGTTDTLAGNPHTASHTYALLCADYTVSASATDDDGTFAAGSVQVSADFGIPSRCYIAQVYEDLFHRLADAGGLAFWSGLVDHGMPRAGVVALMERDAGHEFYRNEIADFYQAYLGRSADEAGMSYWVEYLDAGATLEQTRATFLTSAEFSKTQGAESDDAFLNAAYQSVLHREIDDSGREFFRQALHDGATREQVADLLLGSDEFRRQTAYDFYVRLLHRSPEPAGLEFWTFGLDRNVPEASKLADFLASDEYFARATE
jgi:hypothetical protein